jgi:hypothetical protein
MIHKFQKTILKHIPKKNTMKKNLLILFLIAAIAVMYFNQPTTGNPSGKPSLQPEPTGFEEPLIISDADAWGCVSQFKTLGDRVGITNSGGVITTTALEQLIARSGCNAIAFRLCIDTTGRVAPANKVFVVLGSVNVRYENSQYMATDVSGSRFASRHWCPPTCMKFTVENPSTRRMETFE